MIHVAFIKTTIFILFIYQVPFLCGLKKLICMGAEIVDYADNEGCSCLKDYVTASCKGEPLMLQCFYMHYRYLR